MPSAIVKGGEKGVRVIVNGINENAFEVAAGAEQEVEYEGLLECRTLGMGTSPFPGDSANGANDGNGG